MSSDRSITESAAWPWWCLPSFRKISIPAAGRSVQALLDASDSNTASIGMGYAQAIVQAYSHDVQD